MTTEPQQPKEKNKRTLIALNMAINGLSIAKEASSMTPAAPALSSVIALLTVIKDSMANEADYVELGLFCFDICKALGRGMDGKEPDDLSQSVRDAINELKTTVKEIEKEIIKQSERHRFFRTIFSGSDKDDIAGWKSDLNRILNVFNTELAVANHIILDELRQKASKTSEGNDGENRVARSSVAGESPPPPPRVFFGRDELMEKIVRLAQGLKPIALIGPGGIGKTSIILAALHDDQVKQQFGNNRRFIHCDQFPATRAHLLRRLSKAIGAGIENPEDLTPLRQYLSSKKMMIVLDNAESILGLRGTNAQEIFAVVDELTRFSNICLCITSRISTVPSGCEILEAPTLSIEAGHDTFYQTYKCGERTNGINEILEQLDFHPLSITLLATVAQHNKWDTERLTKEWKRQRTGVLHSQHSGSLAATIELSFASPMFQDLGLDARELLGVIAFFPQGVNEENADWLFPTISDGPHMFDTFCVLSLTYRSNGFVTMLAPLRDYLRPKDPTSSPLLDTTKGHYLSRLPASLSMSGPSFEESRWVVLEDVNVEHLLDVFISADTDSEGVWNACAGFMEHLCWHKPRLVILGPKIEALPDNHSFKALCLQRLSKLFISVGNHAKGKQLLNYSLKLQRERGNDFQAAHTLFYLSNTNLRIGLYKEGIQQAREASEIFERLGETMDQAGSLICLASLLTTDGQLDAAEGPVTHAIDLLPEKGREPLVCYGHRILGLIYGSKDNAEKAIHHFELALEIVPPNLHKELVRIHFCLMLLFSDKGRFGDAHAQIECVKRHAVNDPYNLAIASFLWAKCLERQDMLKEAKSEASDALDSFETLGAADDVKKTRRFLEHIDRRTRGIDPAGQMSIGHRIRTTAKTFFSNRYIHPQATNASLLHPASR